MSTGTYVPTAERRTGTRAPYRSHVQTAERDSPNRDVEVTPFSARFGLIWQVEVTPFSARSRNCLSRPNGSCAPLTFGLIWQLRASLGLIWQLPPSVSTVTLRLHAQLDPAARRLRAISKRSPPSDLQAISVRSPCDLLRGISQKLACASALDTALSTLSNSSAIGASSCASLSACDETDETSHRRSEGFGGQSEAIRGDQRRSEAISGHQWPSVAIRGHQRPSEAIRGHQRPSEAIRGHQRQFEAIRADRDLRCL